MFFCDYKINASLFFIEISKSQDDFVVKIDNDWVYYGKSWAINYNSLLYVDDRTVEVWVRNDILEKDIAYHTLLYEVDIARNRSNLPPSWIRHSPNTVGDGTIQAVKAIARIEELYLVAKQKIKNFKLRKSEFIHLMITDAEYQIMVGVLLDPMASKNGNEFFESIGENVWYIEDIIEHEYKESQ